MPPPVNCEWVRALAIPLPLYVIGRQMGVPDEDMQQIKAWTDSWVARLGLMQTPEERVASAEDEIEAQHYFQTKYEQVRERPNDSLLSDLVNNQVKEWGRTLTDNELHSEMMADLFVGGAETTTNALSGGVMLLIRNPDIWEKVKSDTDRYLEPFIEEVLRLESPVQCLLRETSVDVELHGVTIPAGAIVSIRFAAANRDDRRYESPPEFDLDRKQPRSHLAFGLGTHHCLGAPLARRELYYGFKVLFERFDEIWFIEDENDFHYQPNYFLRALKQLNIGFRSSPAPHIDSERNMLDGKICLVTGSADGIGRATACEMAAQGAGGVMVCDINDEKGIETTEQIRAIGVDAEYRHCDMADPSQIRDLVEATVKRFGGIDVLHNNAGVHESNFTTELNVETLSRGDLRPRLPDQPPGAVADDEVCRAAPSPVPARSLDH